MTLQLNLGVNKRACFKVRRRSSQRLVLLPGLMYKDMGGLFGPTKTLWARVSQCGCRVGDFLYDGSSHLFDGRSSLECCLSIPMGVPL